MLGDGVKPLPASFLDWQIQLRLWTMEQRNGAPHAGVAPLVTVRTPGAALGVVSHSIICGLLPRDLDEKTKAWRALYESGIEEGARAVYDQGIESLKRYYRSPAAEFDPCSVTTLLGNDAPMVKALRAEPRCALVFYVFDLTDKSEVGHFRCLHLDCRAEVLDGGPVYDNVWWHNTLFHGPTEDHVVVHFRHLATWDTRFGRLEPVVD
jgi:hypothetical protein